MASGRLRRDWQKCGDPTRITFGEGAIAFDSRSSSALVWQVPTPDGPFVIDATLEWVRRRSTTCVPTSRGSFPASRPAACCASTS
jgi:hypothetical protein